MRSLAFALLATSALAADSLYFDGPEVVKLDWNTTSPRSGDFNGDGFGDLASGVRGGGVHARAFEHHGCMPRLCPADEGETGEESDTNEQKRHARTLTANRAAGKSCVRCSCRRRGGMIG